MLSFLKVCLLHTSLLLATPDNLENLSQPFILETKRINIPQYPYAFNASMVKWKNKIIMSFRTIDSKSLISCLGITCLDLNFEPIGKPRILDLPNSFGDGRLLFAGDRLYLAYSGCSAYPPGKNTIDLPNSDLVRSKNSNSSENSRDESSCSYEPSRMSLAELFFDGEDFYVEDVDRFLEFEGKQKRRVEKNWVPFEYQNSILFAYSISPHRILAPIMGTGSCDTLCTSESKINWDWGEPRGGTPALLFGDEYLAFFHSWKKMSTHHSDGKEVPHYFVGAYTFSTTPPFEITKISPQPLIGKNFYQGPRYKPYWHPVIALFPCGFIFDEDFIWLSYGKQDHEIWVAKLHKRQLLESLIPIRE